MWDDEEGEFHVRTYVPVTFDPDGENYSVSVELPRNTTDTAMALAFPVELPVDFADSDEHFEGAFNGDTYVAWRALTPMSEISGSVSVNLIGGAYITLDYNFT